MQIVNKLNGIPLTLMEFQDNQDLITKNGFDILHAERVSKKALKSVNDMKDDVNVNSLSMSNVQTALNRVSNEQEAVCNKH